MQIRPLKSDTPAASDCTVWSLSVSIAEGSQVVLTEAGAIQPLIELIDLQSFAGDASMEVHGCRVHVEGHQRRDKYMHTYMDVYMYMCMVGDAWSLC